MDEDRTTVATGVGVNAHRRHRRQQRILHCRDHHSIRAPLSLLSAKAALVEERTLARSSKQTSPSPRPLRPAPARPAPAPAMVHTGCRRNGDASGAQLGTIERRRVPDGIGGGMYRARCKVPQGLNCARTLQRTVAQSSA